MAKTRLKAWIRYGSNGRIIPSVLLVREHRPSGKGWIQVPVDYCCDSRVEIVAGT